MISNLKLEFEVKEAARFVKYKDGNKCQIHIPQKLPQQTYP
jgi:hypothetical protein